ncbi:MAG: amidohydrolase family protein [Actinobacteria bacterium]|nr:amidohydrolase family protein [Actinomycetota bacterium]
MIARAAVACLALLLVGCAGDRPVHGDLLVTADRVFDGERVIEEGAVLIDGRSIARVGRRADLDVEAERTIALGDATLLPGLIDLHVHASSALPELLLANGLTTVRDLAAPISLLRAPRERSGRLRVLGAGPIVTAAPNGYPITAHGAPLGEPVAGVVGARASVRKLVRRGASVIKIALEPSGGLPLLSLAEARAIVDEAHRADRIVTAHVTERRGARLALEAGVDELAHMPCMEDDDRLMADLARARLPVVATLHVEREAGPAFCPAGMANARTFVRAGGQLLYGSDMGNPGIPFGVDVEELRLLRRAGLSAREVLWAATADAGRRLGRAPLGSLVAGAPADLLPSRGTRSPTSDTSAGLSSSSRAAPSSSRTAGRPGTRLAG